MARSTAAYTASAPMWGFHWGAATLTWVWALGNRSFDWVTAVLLALCVTPFGFFAAVALMIYSGATGYERAWRNKDWRDPDHFTVVQRRWSKWGILQFLTAIAFILVMAFATDK